MNINLGQVDRAEVFTGASPCRPATETQGRHIARARNTWHSNSENTRCNTANSGMSQKAKTPA